MKKIALITILSLSSLVLIWCWTWLEETTTNEQTVLQDESLIVSNQWTEDLWMIIHMCLMWWWENCDIYLDPTNKDQYSNLVKEQCDLMPWMEACNTYFDDHAHDWTEGDDHHAKNDNDWDADQAHWDVTAMFELEEFTDEREQTIDSYDITITHNEDTHAWETLVRTIAVQNNWVNLDWFEPIDWDEWVWLIKGPNGSITHLHPVAYTDSSLTFSYKIPKIWEYSILSQFGHEWSVINVPYRLPVIASVNDAHGH